MDLDILLKVLDPDHVWLNIKGQVSFDVILSLFQLVCARRPPRYVQGHVDMSVETKGLVCPHVVSDCGCRVDGWLWQSSMPAIFLGWKNNVALDKP